MQRKILYELLPSSFLKKFLRDSTFVAYPFISPDVNFNTSSGCKAYPLLVTGVNIPLLQSLQANSSGECELWRRRHGLRAGSYAIAVIHDANNDGTLNRNLLGIPTEGFKFSRNPTILMGSPRFVDSAFLVAGSITNIQIQLQYLLGG